VQLLTANTQKSAPGQLSAANAAPHSIHLGCLMLASIGSVPMDKYSCICNIW
jgi:hypothetical protein